MRIFRSRATTIGLTGLLATMCCLASGIALAQTAGSGPAPAAAPDLATRVADLEAYITNSAPKALASAGPGHNAWMMTSTALVLFMTLPGLALFYGGLVRRKNILSVMAQCFGCAGFVTVIWWAVGYSFVFSPGSPILGGTKFALLHGVTSLPNGDYAAWVSQNIFAMYQLMFAIITPALIVGAIAERMKYSAIMAFIVAVDVRGLFSAGPHGLGHRRIDERRVERQGRDQGDRLRRRHGRPHVVGLVGPGAVPDPRQADRIRQADLRCRTAWC
jgi:hypothetical protein